MMINHLVILTCTVNTKMTNDMKRNNPTTRLNDYVQSITKWSDLSRKLGFNVLVVENSNAIELLFKELHDLDNDKLVFAQVGEDFRSHLEGNSAGEFQILKDVLDYNLLQENIEFIWKVTGRLFVPNFKKLLPISTPDFLVNRLYSPCHTIDTRIIGFSLSTFKRLFESNPIFTTSKSSFSKKKSVFSSMEAFVSQEILDSELQGFRIESMKSVPVYSGYAGTNNKVIDTPKSKLKKYIANLVRPLVIKLLAGSVP